MVVPDAISDAAIDGDTAAIQEWFTLGPRDPDDRDKNGQTLLHWAAFNDHCDMMRFLLDHGASVDPIDPDGETPLYRAARLGMHDAAVLLLDRGAQVNSPDDNGETLLIYTAQNGDYDMIRLLLSRGADLAVRDNDGCDAETHARLRDKDEACTLLADVRIAGGDWPSYLRFPRKRLLALRVLCARGRASTDDDLLERVFGPNVPVPQGIDPAFFKLMSADERDAAIGASLRVYPSQPMAKMPRGVARRAQLPKEVFWLVLKFWRSSRDFEE